MLQFSPTAFYQVPLSCFVVVVVHYGVGHWSCLFICVGFFLFWFGVSFLFFPPVYSFVILLFHIKAGKYCARHRKDDGNRDRWGKRAAMPISRDKAGKSSLVSCVWWHLSGVCQGDELLELREGMGTQGNAHKPLTVIKIPWNTGDGLCCSEIARLGQGAAHWC